MTTLIGRAARAPTSNTSEHSSAQRRFNECVLTVQSQNNHVLALTRAEWTTSHAASEYGIDP